MSIEAMRLALEALEEINELSIGENAICLPAEIDTAMDALRQAIEQAERPQTHSEECWRWHHQCAVARIERKAQPVAWRDHVEQRLLTWRQSFVNKSGDQLALDDFMDKRSLDDLIDFVCDEYTALPPQQAEPVAWMHPSWIDPDTKGWFNDSFSETPFEGWTPVYIAPPQRKPLTPEEIEQCCYDTDAQVADHPQTWHWTEGFARAIEAAHGIKGEE